MEKKMGDEVKLYKEGYEEYPVSKAIVGNILMLVWMGLGFWGIQFISPLLAWIFLSTGLLMVFIVLRKLVCTSCYYYGKRCAIGWGKLAAMMFKKGDVSTFPENPGIKIAPATYGLLSLIPLIFIVIAMIQGVTALKITVLVLLVGISAYSGGIGRKGACMHCKMRLICPGCAVKKIDRII
jgi:hypothetical protein